MGAPRYFPPYPSEDGLKRCIDAVRRAGGHAFFWPSGYQWCLSYGKREDGSFEWEDRAGFEREAMPHAMIGKDGKVMLSAPPWYRGGEAATLCRGEQWSRDWLTGIAVGLAQRGGELFQIDQVVGAGMRFGGDCRASGHGHPAGIGIWDVEAAHKQMAEMLAACRAAGVNMVLGYEEPQELFLQEVGIQDYRDYEVVVRPQSPDHRAESVFGYLYHEFVPLFQSNPRAENRQMTAHLDRHWPDAAPRAALAGGAARVPAHGGFEEWVGDVPVGWEHVAGWQQRKFSGQPRRSRHPAFGQQSASGKHFGGEITQVSRNLPIGEGGLRRRKISTIRLVPHRAAGKTGRDQHCGPRPATQSLGAWRLPFPEPGDWRKVSAEVAAPAQGAEVLRVMIHVEGRAAYGSTTSRWLRSTPRASPGRSSATACPRSMTCTSNGSGSTMARVVPIYSSARQYRRPPSNQPRPCGLARSALRTAARR